MLFFLSISWSHCEHHNLINFFLEKVCIAWHSTIDSSRFHLWSLSLLMLFSYLTWQVNSWLDLALFFFLKIKTDDSHQQLTKSFYSFIFFDQQQNDDPLLHIIKRVSTSWNWEMATFPPANQETYKILIIENPDIACIITIGHNGELNPVFYPVLADKYARHGILEEEKAFIVGNAVGDLMSLLITRPQFTISWDTQSLTQLRQN